MHSPGVTQSTFFLQFPTVISWGEDLIKASVSVFISLLVGLPGAPVPGSTVEITRVWASSGWCAVHPSLLGLSVLMEYLHSSLLTPQTLIQFFKCPGDVEYVSWVNLTLNITQVLHYITLSFEAVWTDGVYGGYRLSPHLAACISHELFVFFSTERVEISKGIWDG